MFPEVPQISPWMQHQQSWWKTITHVPSPPSRQREAHEPLSYEESERLRIWRREVEDVIERYEGYLKTEAGQQDLADLEQSRQVALDSIVAIRANDATGECRQRFLTVASFVDFLKESAHPYIGLLKAELRLKLAEFQRERATRPSDRDYIGAEDAFTKHYEDRQEAVKRCETMLSTSYATHAEAIALIANVKTEMSAVNKIPRDQIYPTKIPSRDTTPVVYPDSFNERTGKYEVARY